jgi:hypothetical protein
MRRAERFLVLAIPFAFVPGVALAQGAPLDVTDPTPRNVFVQVEQSSNLSTVGQAFGPAFPATWSASGNTGTLTISKETHEQMRVAGGYTAVPNSFTPIVFEIDLTTLEATSQPASGAMVSGPIGFGFTQQALGTTTTAGYASGGDVPPLFCSSQAQVDAWCQIAPQFCGLTCNLVPGNEYGTDTGEINLVGRETQQGCDGAMCYGPFDMFTPRGDLRLTEAAEIPVLPGLAPLVLFGLLVAGGRALRRCRAA